MLTHPLFLDIGSRHSCSPAVVSLSWAVQRDIIVIPKSSSLNRIKENIRLVTLSEEEMETINQAHLKIGKFRVTVDAKPTRNTDGRQEKIFGWTPEEWGLDDSDGNWLV